MLASNGAEVVPAQSSTTLSVANNIGTATHQLWYKECLVKETTFDACERYVAPVASPQSPVAAPTNTPKAAGAASVGLGAVVSLIGLVALL